MSNNNNRPPLTLPPRVTPIPVTLQPNAMPSEFAEVVKEYPLPWIVGPYDATEPQGYMIFVAADVEPVKDESRMNEYGAVFNGWRPTCPKPRFVVSLDVPKALAELFVFAANKLR